MEDKDYWDEQDIKNGLREKQARIIASMNSGIHPSKATPTELDYEMADQVRKTIGLDIQV